MSDAIQPSNWQAIFGNFDVLHDEIVFRGKINTDEKTSEKWPSAGVIISSVFFSGGSLSAKIQYENAPIVPSVQFVLYRNPSDDSTIRMGFDGGEIDYPFLARGTYTIYDASKATDKTKALAQTAFIEKKLTDSYEMKVEQIGSSIDLYVNGVLMLRHMLTSPLPRSQCGILVRAASDVTITKFRVDSHRRKAFIVMQFSPPYENVYQDVIRPVAESCGLEPEKADDVAGPGLIIADLIRQIQQAEVVIADITPENQNVFYEVGYAHAIGKPTILLAEKGKKLPFDVSGMRVLFYENSIAGKKQLEEGLRSHILAINAGLAFGAIDVGRL